MSGMLELLEQRHGVRAADGLQILSVEALVRRPFDSGLALLVVPHPIDQDGTREPVGGYQPPILPGRHGHGADPLALLRRLYPTRHPVLALDALPDTILEAITDQEVRSRTFLLPPLHGADAPSSPHALPWLVARLRAPDGCPWDREQDHLTLRPFLVEETYEVYDALEDGPTAQLAGELGDLLLQIVLHAQHAAEAGVFDMADVYAGVVAKIVRRHPHVFGDVAATSVGEVVRNWETIKARERLDGATASARAGQREALVPGAFAGLSRSLPALAYAQEMQARAAGLGYDWPDRLGVIAKIAEEAEELASAEDQLARKEEFGDMLFALVNLARKLDIDAEAALRAASGKFASRFARVERLAEVDGIQLPTLGLEALDELWQRAKAEELESRSQVVARS